MPERKLTAREEIEILAGNDAKPEPIDPALAVRRFLAYADAWDNIKADDRTRVSQAVSFPLLVGDIRVVAGLLRESIGEPSDAT